MPEKALLDRPWFAALAISAGLVSTDAGKLAPDDIASNKTSLYKELFPAAPLEVLRPKASQTPLISRTNTKMAARITSHHLFLSFGFRIACLLSNGVMQ